MSESNDQIEAIFIAALDFATENERQAYLDQVCAGNPQLRQRVDQMIQNHFQAGDFLNLPDEDQTIEILEKPGAVIGPYKLLEQIGEGGFGIVFKAQQQHPIQRTVALKVVKPGMDTAQVIARFENERQALALMEHPNIARVLDGGQTPSGRPYFVMELVQGIPITTFCDQQRLGPRERVALFVAVCQAVQHAHQKGIIHRDLKPTNVLVHASRGEPVPVVIDFGVAKALGERLAGRTLITRWGGIIGTLEYMSPEQAEVNAVDVDTRADIYGLGVLLYELLTGSTPLAQERIRRTALIEALRLIREEEPPMPSRRVSDSGESLASISAHRHLEPTRLTRVIRGELDWITMKCLEKNRNRRYETASDLAADLQRFLSGEPVRAGPPTLTYRWKKLLRRHRVKIVSAGLILLSLVGGITGTTLGMIDARRQSRRALLAQEREAQARQRENERANAEAEQRRRAESAEAEAETTIDFLLSDLIGQAGSLAQAQRQFQPNPQLTIREALDRAAAIVGERYRDQPDLEASIRVTIGNSYVQLGQFDKAIEQLETATEIRRQRDGADALKTLNAEDSLANAYRGSVRYADSIALHEHIVAVRTRLLGPDDVATLISRNNLAVVFRDAGRAEDAIREFEQIRDAKIRVLGPEDPATLVTLHNLASMYMDAGDLDRAIPALQSVYDASSQILGPEHPETIPALQNLAVAYWKAQSYDQSIPIFQQLVAIYKKVFGDQHPFTIGALANLGVNYRDAGGFDEAIPLLKEAYQASVGQPVLAWIGRELLIAYERAERNADASALAMELLSEARKATTPDSVELASALANTGATLLRFKAWSEAESVFAESLAIRQREQPREWRTFNTQALLGEALLGQSKFAEAEPMLIAGRAGLIDLWDQVPAGFSQRRRETAEKLVELYEAWGKPEEAERWRQAE